MRTRRRWLLAAAALAFWGLLAPGAALGGELTEQRAGSIALPLPAGWFALALPARDGLIAVPEGQGTLALLAVELHPKGRFYADERGAVVELLGDLGLAVTYLSVRRDAAGQGRISRYAATGRQVEVACYFRSPTAAREDTLTCFAAAGEAFRALGGEAFAEQVGAGVRRVAD